MSAPGWALALLGLSALLLGAAACFAAGALWWGQRQREALHAARQQAAALARQDEAWHWEADAQHAVQAWRGGRGAPPTQAGALLSAHFALEDGDAQALHGRLDAQAGLGASAARRLHDGTLWLLSAEPLTDATGRFAGHLGRAVPMTALANTAADAAVLSLLWPTLPLPVFEARRARGDAPWRLHRCTSAAARLLGLDPAAPPALDWTAALTRLPQPLRDAAAALQPGEQVVQGEWRVSLHNAPLPAPCADGDARVLLLQPALAQSTVAEAAEQESFTYTVSHDLRAPIRVVEGFAKILKEDYGRAIDRIGNDHIDRVLSAAARMHSMIDALLALSRLQTQPLQRQPVDLSQLARYIVDDLRRTHETRNVEVHIEPAIVVHGDPTLLRVALENLLGNAWKYSARANPAHIEFRRTVQEGRAVFLVADNGAGFDMRFADRLFGVFQRLHSANDFQGTGVGLASTRRILRRHGGEIWAEGEVGRGARFYFAFGPAD